MNPITNKLNKKLSLIKILVENPGINFLELSRLHGTPRKEIEKELSQLFMMGMYPYNPDDYIEIDFSQGAISIHLPVSIDRTIHLNPSEWLSILKILEKEKISDAYNKKLQSIFDKINANIHINLFLGQYNLTQTITRFIQEKIRIKIEYWQRKEEKPQVRFVDPLFIFENQHHYLVAYCHLKKGIRNFRIDFIQNVEPTKEVVDEISIDSERHIANFREFINRSQKTSESAEILFSASSWFNIARILDIQIISKSKEYRGKKYVHASTKIVERTWFFEVIKSFGSDIIVLSPSDLRELLFSDCKVIFFPEVF